MPRNTKLIIATLVPESRRMDVADKHFGIRFPITVEPMIFQFASQLAPAYSGGYWNFYQLSNRGFYMTPSLEEPFAVIADNGYEGTMSADALGVTACLYAYSNVSFGEDRFGEKCEKYYHWLYEFAMQHPEAKEIRAAID